LLLFGGAIVALVLAAVNWQHARSSSPETVFSGKTNPPEAAPLCPWREPEADLKMLFPNAIRYELETRTLSGFRLELTERLGRAPMPDENLLHVYRIYGEQGAVGAVVTRRVKGTHGAIEIVVASDNQPRLCGLRLQRIREPEAIAMVLENSEWLRSFNGKIASSGWEVGRDIPGVPVEARASAAAIAEGGRSSLILLAAASEGQVPVKAQHH
jgi:hypothetical protein